LRFAFTQIRACLEYFRNFSRKLALYPLLEGIDLEIVLLLDGQMARSEVFASNLGNYLGLYADCVFGAAGEEVPGDEIIDSPFLSCEIGAICGFHGMDGGVGLIVLVSYFGLHVSSLL
jgi:hypothetical protein